MADLVGVPISIRDSSQESNMARGFGGGANQQNAHTVSVKHGVGSSGGANQHWGQLAGVKHGAGAKHVEGVR